MNANLKSVLLRLIDALGHCADADSFSEEDAWSFAEDLSIRDTSREPIPQPAVRVLEELGAVLGLRPGASADAYRHALESHLGPAPSGTIVEAVVNMTRAAINGAYEGKADPRSTARLDGGTSPAPPVPLGNLDFEK